MGDREEQSVAGHLPHQIHPAVSLQFYFIFWNSLTAGSETALAEMGWELLNSKLIFNTIIILWQVVSVNKTTFFCGLMLQPEEKVKISREQNEKMH